ncbi:MAG: serine hydrolase [Bacteroidota bacterium]
MKHNTFKFKRIIQYGLLGLLLLTTLNDGFGQKRKWYIEVGKNGKVGFINDKTDLPKDSRLIGMGEALQNMLNTFNVPGASVVIVEKDKVLLAKGFGYKDLQAKVPVTENTLFPIGSCTKAFTAALMGTLSDEKKVDFDLPVNNYLPELQFKKPELTQQVTLRDMMTHRTGLPRHDFAWYLRGSTADRMTLLHAIRYFDVSAGLRETWQYNNYMYMAQGALAEKITGKTWEQLVAARIFAPIGMEQAVLSTPDLVKSPDHALGYSYNEKDKTIEQMDYYYFSGMEPAGSISVGAQDMAKWLKLWIHGGQWAGKPLFSTAFYQQAIKTQMAMAGSGDRPELNSYVYGYGLGWMVKGYKGHHFIEHGGNIDGFSATTGFFPNDSIGIYVCVNQNNSDAQLAIRNWIADRMLGLNKTDWTALLMPKPDEAPSHQEADLSQVSGTQASHPLAEYTGIYQNEGYGDIKVFLHDNSLWATFGNDTVHVEHFHYDIFKMKSDKLDASGEQNGIKIRFHTGYNGAISGFDGQLEPALPNGIEFTRQPLAMEISSDELKKYEGIYSMGGAKIKVYTQNNGLRMSVPGQPEYELAPHKPDEFRLTIAEGYFIRFEMKDGKAVAAYSIQPDGTFKMVRD